MNNLGKFICLILLIGAIGCTKPSPFTKGFDNIKAENFVKEIDGAEANLYFLTNNNGMGMKVTNYGARVVALCVPDKTGKPVDVVLGYNTLDEYINQPENYFGAAIGRFGNRIGKATFSIDSVTYALGANDGENHLHGGKKGYFGVVWNAEQVNESKIIFTYRSVDGDEGYPGNLDISMIYEVTADNEFKIEYVATTDKKTICNLTHHTYFNLSGEGAETINDHVLMIKSDRFTPVDNTLIPTGELAMIVETPMDFSTPTVIGERLEEPYEQLSFGNGYDHNWVINKEIAGVELVASVESPVTGIVMDVLSDQPGLQFYGGNFLNGQVVGKSGKPYVYRSAFCLETQHFPDSPNKPEFPSVLLEPGSMYKHTCIYKFSVKE
jgi:aldose 1-epimerase